MHPLLQVLTDHPPLLFTFAALFGAVFGSFLNAAIYRLPRNISLLTRTRSFCPSCNHDLAWYDNVPILSYLVLRGRCHYCRKPIGARYLLIELVTVAMVELAVYHCLILNPVALGFAGLLELGVFGLGSILLIATDMESFIIPEEASLVPLVVSLALAWWLPGQHLLADRWVMLHTAPAPGGNFWTDHAANCNALIDAVQGAVLAAATVYGLGAVGTWWKRVEAMGGGDVLLMAAVGATVGWKLGVITIFLAAFVGIGMYIVQSLWLLVKKRAAATPRFELTDENSPPPAWYARLLDRLHVLPMGVLLLLSDGGLWLYARERTQLPGASNELLFGPVIGAALGTFFILFHFVRAHHEKQGTWIDPQVETQADGKEVEVYDTGHAYIAFGPALALAGLVMAIWGPWLMRLIEIKMGWPPQALSSVLPHVPFFG
ncbi:MAG: prepilin peptidase [Planctomycetota bacterium]